MMIVGLLYSIAATIVITVILIINGNDDSNIVENY